MKHRTELGKPGRGAYSRGCRCADCTWDNTEYTAEYRANGGGVIAQRVHARARSEALKWIKREHYDVWEALLDQAWLNVAGRRPEQRRPRASK
jgi:hypothetical protein